MKSLKIVKKNSSIHVKLLLYMMLSVALTIFVLTPILYTSLESILTSRIIENDISNMSKISRSAIIMKDWASILLVQINNDTIIQKALNKETPDPLVDFSAYKRLQSYNFSAPYIKSIYAIKLDSDYLLSIGSNKFVYSKDEFFDREILSILEDTETNRTFIPIARKIRPEVGNTGNSGNNVISFISYDIITAPQNAIVLNVDESWLLNLMYTLEDNQQKEMLITDSSGTTVISSGQIPALENLSNEKHIRQILQSNEPTGNFITDYKSEKHLVVYVKLKNSGLDWNFISIVPYSLVTNEISSTRNLAIAIGLIILAISLAILILTSRKFLKPVINIEHKLLKLQSQRNKDYLLLKKDFMQNLVKSYSKTISNIPESELSFLEISLNFNQIFDFVLLKIDSYNNFCNKYNNSDRSLFRFAIANIANEIASELNNSECIDMDDNHIILIINSPDTRLEKTYSTDLIKKIERIQHESLRHLEISVSAVIVSNNSFEQDGLRAAYEIATETLDQLVFTGHGSIIQHEDKTLKSTRYKYPAKTEKALIDALMLSKMDTVKSIFDSMLYETKGHYRNTLNMLLFRLTHAVNSATDQIQKNAGIPVSYDFNLLLSKVTYFETIDEIRINFFDMFDNIYELLNIKKNNYYDEMIKEIINNIHENYSDCNLSVETFSSKYNLSSAYIGRLFKKDTMKSVAEYINIYRIEKSKELLLNSNYSINVIAEKVGIVNTNYYYTLFRKLNGITPLEFKKNWNN